MFGFDEITLRMEWESASKLIRLSKLPDIIRSDKQYHF